MINPKLLSFFTAIKQNNNKEWYDKHKEEYKILSKEFEELLLEISDQIAVFDSALKKGKERGNKTVKIFRIHKDTRFTKDKSKYKTSISGMISANIENETEPVYYIAIGPNNQSYIGGGIRSPQNDKLTTIRNYICEHYKSLTKILSRKELQNLFPEGMSDEYKLKKAPLGYNKEHPAINLLRYKNFTIGKTINDSDLKNKNQKAKVIKEFQALVGFNDFLRSAFK
jgi:uncharacterized protein (TIGR02453 family)